ncbi:MAG: hypothetical protein EXS38_10185 [Opitutus sp.]|nr:hypothetical protein [Opitutus sp.]
MKNTLIGIIVGLALGAVGMRLMTGHGAADKPAEAAPAKAEAKKENPLQLNAAKRDAAGIVLARPKSGTLTPEVKGFGRVLDATPLIALMAEEETARAAWGAAQKELARLKQLFASDTNVSAQAVEAAETIEMRVRLAVDSAHRRLASSWGRDVAGPGGKSVLEALEKGAALARVDLMPGDAPTLAPKSVGVALPGGEETFSADVLGLAPAVDLQMPGTSFLVLVRDHPLPAGAALRSTITGAGNAESVLLIPRSAVVYHQGSAWIYVLGEEDTFERKIVSVGRIGPDGVAILSGLDPDNQVVTTGAQQLLSAELQAGTASED